MPILVLVLIKRGDYMGQQSSLTDVVIPPSDLHDNGRDYNDINTGELVHGYICKITVHCMGEAGQLEPEECVESWNRSDREASSNYLIGPTGRVGLFIKEDDRAWTSNNRANDAHAITIEVASDARDPYAMKDAAYQKLILLCADICTRYNFKLNYTGGPDGSLTGHFMFDTVACPGQWFKNRYTEFVNAVNAKVAEGVFKPDELDDSNKQREIETQYDYYLITETSKQNQPGECGNKITASVYLGRW